MKILYVLLLASLLSSPAAAHTGIGSGGDVLAAYLEEARARLVEALGRFRDASSAAQNAACADQGLSAEQALDCAVFLRAVAPTMVAMHSGPRRPPFALSKEPVTVIGTDGLPLRVAASTLTGPDGPVTFDYALILRRSPRLLMALVAHETGHKVPFQGDYVGDDAPVLAFATGRALLDAAGLAIGTFAERSGIIGQDFAVRDKFYCEIKLAGTGTSFYQSGDAAREFLSQAADDKPYDVFRTGIGPEKRLQIGVVQGETCLALELTLSEASGCASDGDLSRRTIDIKVHRLFREQDGSTPAPVLLNASHAEGWNPACEDDVAARERPLEIAVDGVIFTCTYKGMAAAAHAASPRAAPPCDRIHQ